MAIKKSKKKKGVKVLICLQYWNAWEEENEGDFRDAMALADIIAKIQSKPDKDVDFMFAPRFDSDDPDYDTQQRLKGKFREVIVRRSEREAVGWPTGCNNLWHDCMMWAYRQVKEGKKDWDFVLTIEGDCVPTAIDWLAQLKDYWKKNFDIDDTLIMGHMVEHGVPHINGNAMFSPWLNQKFPEAYGTPPHAAWDMYWAPRFNEVAIDCPLIQSNWRCDTITKAELFEPRLDGIKPVLVHGVKDGSARAIITKELL